MPTLGSLPTILPSGRRLADRRQELVDRFIGFDPGLTQLRNAAHAILALSLAVFLGYLFERVTGAMRIDGGGLPAAVVEAQHHGALIIALLLPGIIAMLDSTGVNDGTIRRRLISSAGLLTTFFLSMTIGLVVAEHRLPLLVWLVIAPMVAVYIRRFPTRGFVLGVALFNGAFMAYFMHDQIHFHDLGWVAAELTLGTVASVAIRLLVFRPDNTQALVRMQRAWVARTHTISDLAWQLSGELTGSRREHIGESLQRQLIRLNESSLMIDAQLAQPDVSEGSITLLHQRLFDQELALSNIARLTEALTNRTLEESVRRSLRETLAALRDQQLDKAAHRAKHLQQVHIAATDSNTPVLVHRLARSVVDLAEAQEQWMEAGRDRPRGETQFVPAVQLMAGFLPGSGAVSERAGDIPGSGLMGRVVLKPYLRSTLQIGVAAAIAVVIGDILDGKRLYWALLATFLAFMATSNTGEQVRKAVFRLLGTAFGIVIGDGLVHLAGGNLVVSLIVIAVAMFIGFYLVRVNYMFLVVGLTITMSQLYVQLNEFSWHLLLLRLAETGVGAGAVIIAVVVIFPLRPSRVLETAIDTYLESLQDLVAYSLSTLSRLPAGVEARPPTRLDVRELDAAYQSLLITAQPLRIGLLGHRQTRLNEGLAVASAARYYARNLAAGVEYSDVRSTPEMDAAAAVLLSSLTALREDSAKERTEGERSEGENTGGEHSEAGRRGVYIRSAALFDQAYRTAAGPDDSIGDARLVVRDIMLLDGAMARLARARGMTVVDTDTGTASGSAPGRGLSCPTPLTDTLNRHP
ncbi:MAG: hypothetical protein JWM76_1217 [Pseudonocardiales bacterium]|nr:hypothetical protein [Pseudonocardiales bacterium]